MFFTDDKQRLDRRVTHAFNAIYVNHVKKASSFNTFYLNLMDNVFYCFKNELHFILFWALFRCKSIRSKKNSQEAKKPDGLSVFQTEHSFKSL